MVSIFLLEDDLSFGTVLKSYLEISGYSVTWIQDGNDAERAFREGNFDLSILDVMLPNIDGFAVGTKIKQIDSSVPLIYLTAKSMKEDILRGYAIGADDYVTKPFDTEVLLAKINAILMRKGSVEVYQKSISIGKFLYDLETRELMIEGEVDHLSPKEGALLELLYKNMNRLLTREVALKSIWGDDDYFTSRSMDVFITKLRKYLKKDPEISIKNIHGSGFIMSDKLD